MRWLALLIILNIGGIDINKIARINKLKKEAETAYRNGEYDKAIAAFSTLIDSLGVAEDPLFLNLANAFFHKNDTLNAAKNYSKALESKDSHIRSLAHQQLGIIQQQQNKMKEALTNFKAALLADPTNEDARYNYELLKKLMKEQQNQQQQNKEDKKDQKQDNKKDQQNKDQQQNKKDQQKDQQQKQDQQQKDQQQQNQQQKQDKQNQQKQDQQQKSENKQGDKKDQQQQAKPENTEEKGKEMNKPPMSRAEKLKELNLTEEKARMILEAMKNQEIQYIQQNQRKPKKRPDNNKPDW